MSEDHNLIKEIEEEVKQDEYKNLWNKYKIYIFISVIFIKLYLEVKGTIRFVNGNWGSVLDNFKFYF